MKKHQRPPTAVAAPPAASADADAFALASARLAADRPLRHPRLQQIGVNLQNNRLLQAERELNEYLVTSPGDPDALSLLARTLVRQGRRGDAIPVLERCLGIAPAFASARFNLANLLVQANRFDDALAQVESLLSRDATHPLFRQLKGNVLEATGQNEQALLIWEQLANDHPRRAECWIRYGHALRALGLQDRCIAAYRRAIECRPSFGAAYWSLADLRTWRFAESDIAAMQAQVARPDIPADDRVTLQFSLGKALEDQGAYEQSFVQYDQGNAAMRQRISYEPDTLTTGVARHRAVFTQAFLSSRATAGCPSAEPIFIVSRPRSGSTLVEQILASHSAIDGTAELPYVMALAGRLGQGERQAYGTGYLDALARLDPPALAALGEEYLRNVRSHQLPGRAFFIDKMPANFYHLGLIHLMLPNAKIIDVRRNPAATCFSIFKSYSSKGMLRLHELGRFYRDYVQLMAHFDHVLPGRVHRLVYEDLVRDPQAEVRRLLDHLGLPFEERCLRFHETERKLLTPSSEQVRRPISSGAVDHWRHYEPWLGPLIDSLGSALTAYPCVPEELR